MNEWVRKYEVAKDIFDIDDVTLPLNAIVLSSFLHGHKIDNFRRGIEHDKIAITYLRPKMTEV
jgi:hypothetical protein